MKKYFKYLSTRRVKRCFVFYSNYQWYGSASIYAYDIKQARKLIKKFMVKNISNAEMGIKINPKNLSLKLVQVIHGTEDFKFHEL